MARRKLKVINRNGEMSNRGLWLHSLKNNKKALMVLGFIFVLLILLALFLYNRFYKYDHYSVLSSVKLKSTEKSKFVSFGNFVVKYSNDGISYIDGEEVRWDEAYEMKAPIVDVCDEYLVIADKNTNDIYIYDENGRCGNVTVNYPIVQVEISSQGVVAALEEEQNANYIEAYDLEGNQLISHKTIIDENGYPLNFSLSEDGEKMMVSYLAVNNGVFHNKVVFYDFSKDGEEYKNRIAASFEDYEETVVPKVSFVSSSKAVAVGEDVISIYDVGKTPKLSKSIDVKHQIQKVFMNEDYVGITYLEGKGDSKSRIEVYNMNGTQVMSSSTSQTFQKIDFVDDNVLIYDDLNCKMISFYGVEKFTYTFNGEISSIIPLPQSREFLLITNAEIQKIRIK
ncbi:MAG: DUF5711 family protein [Eubacterium sp.]|nr:DUF5711 family protein [Eubacterium sp.]